MSLTVGFRRHNRRVPPHDQPERLVPRGNVAHPR